MGVLGIASEQVDAWLLSGPDVLFPDERLVGVVRSEDRGEHGDQHEDHDDREADHP